MAENSGTIVDSEYSKSSFVNYIDFIKLKVTSATILGGVYGTSIGYLAGDMTALYGYTYGLGLGVASCSFYSLAYGIRLIRQREDIYNYVASGSVNAGLMISLLSGYKRGGIAAVGGGLGGALLKIGGDYTYKNMRSSWIEHRRHNLEYSTPRILKIRKPTFPPKEERNKTFLINRKINEVNKDS